MIVLPPICSKFSDRANRARTDDLFGAITRPRHLLALVRVVRAYDVLSVRPDLSPGLAR